jgi:hypothetical protein
VGSLVRAYSSAGVSAGVGWRKASLPVGFGVAGPLRSNVGAARVEVTETTPGCAVGCAERRGEDALTSLLRCGDGSWLARSGVAGGRGWFCGAG